ncbi:MAG: hypothetical protein ABJK11_07930 [Balneola sp.]
MDRREYFFQLGSLNVLFDAMDEKSQKAFLRSLNKNPYAFLFSFPPKEEVELCDFDNFNNYFIYNPIIEDRRVYFIEKSSLVKVKRNIIVSMKNEFILNQKWRN